MPCYHAVFDWLLSVTFVYCVETAKNMAKVANVNRKPYPSFRKIATVKDGDTVTME